MADVEVEDIVRLHDEQHLSFQAIADELGGGWDRARVRDLYLDRQQEPSMAVLSGPFEAGDVEVLREIVTWWKRRRMTEVIPSNTQGKRTRRTFWIDDQLYGQLKQRADQDAVSAARIVDTALRLYLEDT